MTREEKFNDYDGFVEKFKPKKTTDDCMTPPAVYDAVRAYACQRFGIDPDAVVRPFWPGADYTQVDYTGRVVIDNPPFSILSKICRFYLERGIAFFLFAPSLTCLCGQLATKMNHLICDVNVIYENGAEVRTSFVTSYGLPTVLESCPELTRVVNAAVESTKQTTDLPKYVYPYEVVTTAMLQRYAKYGVRYTVDASNAVFVRRLDAQKAYGKSIYGGGLLLSERAAAERAAAERAAAERAAAIEWALSDAERAISKNLSY